MNKRRLEEMAGEYVLGTLSKEERMEVERAVHSDGTLRAEVGFWETVVAATALSHPPVTPSPELWDRIEAGLDSLPPPGTVSVRVDDGEWVTLGPGVEKKLLHRDTQQGIQSFLLRLKPGAVVPAHDHPKTEECVVLEGDLRMGADVLRAGEYHLAPAGIPHPALTTTGGALVFLRGSL